MIRGLNDSDKKTGKENSQVTHHAKADSSSEFSRLIGGELSLPLSLTALYP